MAGHSYLGRGVYDIAEVARLLRRPRQRVEGWTRTGTRKTPLLTGEFAELFSFWDLMSLRVIAELLGRGVRRDATVTGAEHLSRRLGTDRPFAHKDIATVGTGFFARVEAATGWEDVGQGGQLAFEDVVLPLLRPVTFDASGMAAIWRPQQGVWINPAVQAGEPCVDGTRIPTRLLAGLLPRDGDLSGDNMVEVLSDYRLSEGQVRAAVSFECSLAA